jgi:hypothetical protein
MSRGFFRRAKIEAERTAVSHVAIARTPGSGQMHATQTAEGIDVGQIGL